MAEPTQYSFTWAEVAELMIKKLGLREGEWMPGLEFTLNVGVVGISPAEAGPGVMAFAAKLQLTQVQPDGNAPRHMIVDASKVNPASGE